MGDVLLQKTYTTNLFEGKHKKNNGEVTQYYIKNRHPAIVSREMFQSAQEELARRNSKKPAAQKKAKDEPRTVHQQIPPIGKTVLRKLRLLLPESHLGYSWEETGGLAVY